MNLLLPPRIPKESTTSSLTKLSILVTVVSVAVAFWYFVIQWISYLVSS